VHPPDAFADPPVYVGESDDPSTIATSAGHVIAIAGTGVVVAGAVVVGKAVVVVVVPSEVVVEFVATVGRGAIVGGPTITCLTVGGWT
jgi:hypothetical protein